MTGALIRDQAPATDAAVQYRRNRDLLTDALDSILGVTCPSPAGGMFVFPDASGLLAGGPWASTVEPADWLLDVALVAVVPGEALRAPGDLRLCFAVSPDALSSATERLGQHLREAQRSHDTTRTRR